MFNQEVQITFSLAVREAQRRRHEYLTTEHVLYAMLFEEHGQEIIVGCGGDVASLRDLLEGYFSQHLQSAAGDGEAVPQQTLGLQRVLQRTVEHMQAAGKKEITVGDVLAAILEERHSHAAHFLSEQGISRLDVLNYISHRLSKVSQGDSAEPAPGREGRNLDHLCLRVEPFDQEAIVAHLKRHGVVVGEIRRRYGAEGNGISIYVADPEGNTVELKGPSDGQPPPS